MRQSLAFLAVVIPSTVTHAEGSTWSLTWQAPEQCPSEQEVRETVQTWLAQSIEPTDPKGVRVQASVQPDPTGFALDLVLVSQTGQMHEQMVAERCETLAGVVALKVALAADPAAWFTSMQSQRTEPVHEQSFGLRLAAGAGSFVLPSTGAVLELVGFLRFASLGFELGAGYALPNEARHPDLTTAGADVDLLYANGRVCLLPNIAALEFQVCGGADLGMMRARGFGDPLTVTDLDQPIETWLALVIGTALRWPVTDWFSPWLGVKALASVTRPSYVIQNLGTLYKTPALGAHFLAGGELNFE